MQFAWICGTGPEYRKIGRRVIYAVTDVVAWAESGAKQSTSDPHSNPAPAKRATSK